MEKQPGLFQKSRILQGSFLALAVTMAVGVKVWLLKIHAVPFNSDEAIVGLMARHINQGARPIFFYGQAYMGSLDAWLVAGAFRILGEQVVAIRVVQILSYLAFLVSTWFLCRRLFPDPRIADFTVLIAAVPTVLVSTYTTASLGGYGEILVLGNLILWLGYEVLFGAWRESWAAWLGFGLVGGLGFWTLGMAGVYLLPIGLIGLVKFKPRFVPFYLIAVAGFFIGSSPWWVGNTLSGGEGLAFLEGTSRLNLVPTTPFFRLRGLLLLGFPTLIGVRFPWSPEMALWPIAFLGIILALGGGMATIEVHRRKKLSTPPEVVWLLSLFLAVFLAAFVGSHFGLDSTGRYLLPLNLLYVISLGIFTWVAWDQKPALGIGLLLLVVLFNGFETWQAATSRDRLTTQFDPITRFDNRHDADLIAFLQENGELRGYTNYWVAFRMAFLSGEEIIFSPRLPDKEDLSYTDNYNRVPEYDRLVSESSDVAYITTKHPRLDAILREKFTDLGVAFEEIQIGDYRVFYRLSRVVRPDELGF